MAMIPNDEFEESLRREMEEFINKHAEGEFRKMVKNTPLEHEVSFPGDYAWDDPDHDVLADFERAKKQMMDNADMEYANIPRAKGKPIKDFKLESISMIPKKTPLQDPFEKYAEPAVQPTPQPVNAVLPQHVLDELEDRDLKNAIIDDGE